MPITLPQAEIDKLIDDASRGANATITVDLASQEIRGPDGGVIHFDIDPFRKRCLTEGLDDIGLTLQKAEHIDGFETEVKGTPSLGLEKSGTRKVEAQGRIVDQERGLAESPQWWRR